MRTSSMGKLVLAAALMGSLAAPAAAYPAQTIPTMTVSQAERLPPSELPRVFRSPTNAFGYPYNIHETDGLSRNPSDCTRWGCVDVP
jgi:hypothetical protein